MTHAEAEAILATGRPLTQAERAQLEPIRMAFHVSGTKGWGGVYIREQPLPTEGRRRYVPHPDDEEAWAIHFKETL